MALVSDIQLQNGSVIPISLDAAGNFTAASFTATTGFAAGETTPISLSGFLTLKSANNVAAWLQTTKTDGDASFYLNNDSNVYWNVKVSGTAVDSFVIETASGDQAGRITPFSIKPAGHIGFGTINPPTDVVAEFYANDSISAAIELKNAKNNIVIRQSAEATSGSIGTITNSPFGIKVNDTDAITIATNGNVTIAGLQGQSDGHAIYNEGVLLTDRTKMNFVGSAVNATDVGDSTVVTVQGQGSLIPFWLEADTQDNIDLASSNVGNGLSGDVSPALGGNLDVITYDIVSTSNRDIEFRPHGTGKVYATSLTADSISAGIFVGGTQSITGYADNPLHWTVTAGVTWTFGWWQSSNSQWWLLGNTTQAGTFTRAQAEFYIPTGDIADVPTS